MPGVRASTLNAPPATAESRRSPPISHRGASPRARVAFGDIRRRRSGALEIGGAALHPFKEALPAEVRPHRHSPPGLAGFQPGAPRDRAGLQAARMLTGGCWTADWPQQAEESREGNGVKKRRSIGGVGACIAVGKMEVASSVGASFVLDKTNSPAGRLNDHLPKAAADERPEPSETAFSIAAVDATRAWRRTPCQGVGAALRRFSPTRDANGERVYERSDQVEKLRMIRRLLDHGRRPARIVGASVELSSMLDSCLCPGARLDRSRRRSAAARAPASQRGARRCTAPGALMKRGCSASSPDGGAAGGGGGRGVDARRGGCSRITSVLRAGAEPAAQRIGAHAASEGRPRVLLTTFPRRSMCSAC